MLRARIVEAEAYEPDDPASHSFPGQTARNATMFGPPGRLYVYRSYGVHHCMNVVTGPVGRGSAVLLRAAEPLEGLEEMAAFRGTNGSRDLCRGPGRWSQAFAVDTSLDGEDLIRGDKVWLEAGGRPALIYATPRVGLTRAVDVPWRFVEAGSRFSSRSDPRAPTPWRP